MSDINKDITELDELPMNAIDLDNPLDGDDKKIAMLREEKDKAISMVKIASFDGRLQDPYPTPFLNLSDTKIPRTSTEIFKWCKYFYTFDPLIAGAINALSTFPVTEIYLEDVDENGKGDKNEDSDTLILYKKIFFKDLNIYKMLIEIGIDYYLYGNCFIFGELHTNKATGSVEWKNMVRLDPNRVIIDYNPATKEKKFKWRVSPSIAKIIKDKKPKDEYNKIPDIMKEAVLKNNSIVLNSNNIYHFPRPTDSAGDNNIWGTPIIANVLKLLMYRNILRQSQEAIAREHIVPMRVYYLDRTNDYNPTADWNKVASNFAAELNKSVKDPNYKVVSPVPVNLIKVGGQGRALLLTPEIEQIQAEILAGMNVPREFIFGGVGYSGSSISLKILENQFITYRLLLKDFMQNFIIKNMAKARKEWVSEKDDSSLITVKMMDLKMQDDVQQKQLVIQLNQAGKCTNEYMWKVIGMDPDKMRESLKDEAIEAIKTDTEIKMEQLKSQLELQKVQMQVDQEIRKFQLEMYKSDPQMNQEEAQMSQEQQMMQQPMQGQGQSQDQGMHPAAQGQMQPEQMQPEQNPAIDESDVVNEDAQIQNVALQLIKTGEKGRDAFLASLPDRYKQKVIKKMQELTTSMNNQQGAGIDMRPMPEQKPPRRDSLK